MNVPATQTLSKADKSWFSQQALFNTAAPAKPGFVYLPFFIPGTEWCIRMIPNVVTCVTIILSTFLYVLYICQALLVSCEPAFYLCLSQLYNSPVYRCHMLDWLSSG